MPSTLETFLNSNPMEISEPKNVKKHEGPLLSFGDTSLDESCGGVYLQTLTVLYGEKICQTVAEQLCVNAQLPIDAGGLNARSVFIDGGNTFDPYHVSHYAATLRLDRDEVLRAISVSRAFTCYQLVNLIVEKLPELLCEQEIGFVVVSNLLDLFMDSELDRGEVRHTVNFLSSFLARLTRQNRIALVVTCSSHKDARDASLRQFLTSRAQIVLRAERRERKPVFLLEKHPFREAGSLTATANLSGFT